MMEMISGGREEKVAIGVVIKECGVMKKRMKEKCVEKKRVRGKRRCHSHMVLYLTQNHTPRGPECYTTNTCGPLNGSNHRYKKITYALTWTYNSRQRASVEASYLRSRPLTSSPPSLVSLLC